ncbi:MAG TPA: DUF4136 domain-containing protein [Verrucomicrobiota bacterium]|nr:DUF4136 domain-containing protein [Verrucomicrobiota bacterium]
MKLPAAALLAALLLTACATGPRVAVDRDPSVEVGRFETFAFFSPLGTDRGGYQTLLSERLKAATRTGLEALGYRYDEAAPQMLVNFGARTDERIEVSTFPGAAPPPYFGYYGYRGSFYGGWPGYSDRTVVDQYQEGTINLDVVEAATRRLVWEGVAVGRVSRSAAKDPAAGVTVAVNAILAKFPPRGP